MPVLTLPPVPVLLVDLNSNSKKTTVTARLKYQYGEGRVAAGESTDGAFTVKSYPNPATDIIYFDLKNSSNDTFDISITNNLVCVYAAKNAALPIFVLKLVLAFIFAQ